MIHHHVWQHKLMFMSVNYAHYMHNNIYARILMIRRRWRGTGRLSSGSGRPTAGGAIIRRIFCSSGFRGFTMNCKGFCRLTRATVVAAPSSVATTQLRWCRTIRSSPSTGGCSHNATIPTTSNGNSTQNCSSTRGGCPYVHLFICWVIIITTAVVVVDTTTTARTTGLSPAS